MKLHFARIARAALFLTGSILCMAANRAEAQNNSLYSAEQQLSAANPSHNPQAGAEVPRPGMALADMCWTYQSAPEPKLAKLHDIVKVTVKVKSQMSSEGKIDRKKVGHGALTLTNWIKFYGGNLGENGGTNGQPPYGTPEIRGDVDNQLSADGNLQTNDTLTFTISCWIVDKRPNGNCVLEGTWSVANNEENWEYSLSGEVRPEDIKPDNSVISDTIAGLKITKKEAGHVRDSYRRGWALEWLDKWQPF